MINSRILPTILFLFSLGPFNAFAGLYQCSEDGSGIVINKSVLPANFCLNSTRPKLFDNAENSDVHKGKKPFLFYYAVDSEEAFMQYSIKLEVEQLKKVCKESPDVNFVVLLNSLYLAKNEITVCKNQTVEQVALTKFARFNQSLLTKLDYLSLGDHTSNLLGPMTMLVRYPLTTNDAFKKYPFAHPDFLYDFLKLVLSEPSLFPSNVYMPFVNLKSHGSKRNLLSGLQECQAKAKVKSQEKMINDHLSSEQKALLQSESYSPQYLELLDKLDIGPNSGSRDPGPQPVELGSTGLGCYGPGSKGLGSNGLGSNGLGSNGLGSNGLG
jgi:hypothetical protein